MNPIEKFFGSVKAELRGKNKNNYTNLDALFHQDEAGPMKLDPLGAFRRMVPELWLHSVK